MARAGSTEAVLDAPARFPDWPGDARVPVLASMAAVAHLPGWPVQPRSGNPREWPSG